MTHFADILSWLIIGLDGYAILLFFSIPAFFLWRQIFRKFIKNEKKRKIATWCATIIATPVIYATLLFLFLYLPNHPRDKNFDKSQWLADKEKRYLMANDIVDSKILMGKDTSQVKQILGEANTKINEIRCWDYYMGWGTGGLGFLFHILSIKFENDKVVLVEHVERGD